LNESQEAKKALVEALEKLEEELWETDAHTNAYNLIVELEVRGYMIVKWEDVKDKD
jgi:hypothetical protein